MSEFTPIASIGELAAQDGDDMLQGYLAGLAGDPEPGNDKSRGFWHGWRNGMTDSGRAPVDSAQRYLAAQFVRNQRLH